MDHSTLVVDQIDDGRHFVERFAADGNPVRAAFWVRVAEEGLWFLYVVTEAVDRGGPAAAYRAVHAALSKLDEPRISGSEIKVISPNNPIAREILEIMARHPGRLATWVGTTNLGLIDAEQIYIYPPQVFTFTQAAPMTTEEISREILRLMNRAGSVQPPTIALKDGTSFNGVPFSIELGSHRAMVVKFMAIGDPAPRVVRLDEIASIS